METTKLKFQIKDQSDSIKQLESTNEMLQQEVKKIKEIAESTTEMTKTQLYTYDND